MLNQNQKDLSIRNSSNENLNNKAMKKKTIKTFYHPLQVCQQTVMDGSYSKSPLKPELLLAHMMTGGFDTVLDIFEGFKPFEKTDFYIAHSKEYVDEFFQGIGLCESNGLPWSPELAKSVKYTNSSLYHAMKYACENPEVLTFSPTSGFHHAQPDNGSGFCTFSGQVIASLKLYKKFGLKGAYLDLDGHFGNSIPDSQYHIPEVGDAIVMNINPKFKHKQYIEDFKADLADLENKIKNGEVDYVVWCHGADSHEWDNLGTQCTTKEWLECSELFYTMIKDLEEELGKPIPVTLSLFGGYRNDDYESVLSLHASDIKVACEVLLEVSIDYETEVYPLNYRKKMLSSKNEGAFSKIKRA